SFNQIIEKEKVDVPRLASFIVNQRKTLMNENSELIYQKFLASTQKKVVENSEIEKVIADVISKNQKAVAEYKGGKQNAFQFLLGQCMRVLGHDVDSMIVIANLKKKLV
ncbi:MAG: hypothetical protein AAB893_04500, partial [Patescibacteria group bacterium]